MNFNIKCFSEIRRFKRPLGSLSYGDTHAVVIQSEYRRITLEADMSGGEYRIIKSTNVLMKEKIEEKT